MIEITWLKNIIYPLSKGIFGYNGEGSALVHLFHFTTI